MKKNIILSVVCGMVAMASLTSCSDFLQVNATNQKEMDHSFTTYDELRLAPAYLYMVTTTTNRDTLLIVFLRTNRIPPVWRMHGTLFILLLRRRIMS